jgi:hypothetical protein
MFMSTQIKLKFFSAALVIVKRLSSHMWPVATILDRTATDYGKSDKISPSLLGNQSESMLFCSQKLVSFNIDPHPCLHITMCNNPLTPVSSCTFSDFYQPLSPNLQFPLTNKSEDLAGSQSYPTQYVPYKFLNF